MNLVTLLKMKKKRKKKAVILISVFREKKIKNKKLKGF
jgi:hypothetical protein